MIYESRTIAEVVEQYMAMVQERARTPLLQPRMGKVIAWYRPTHVRAVAWVPQESRGRLLVMPAGGVA